ncbi:MAG: hypothetical protein GX537_06675 [Actinobacteria bacterium]|nr:hypothetical protein [Actinomycetota bacterium]
MTRPEPTAPEYTNYDPAHFNPAAFPRLSNATWLELVRLRLSALQWEIVVTLMVMQLGTGKHRAARQVCGAYDEHEAAADDFGCEAVAVNSGLIASHLGRNVVAVRRELRRLAAARIVTVHEQGYKGRPQVLSVNLEPDSWRPDALRESYVAARKGYR